MIPLRDENPTRRAPVVTWALIALNVMAFVWESALVEAGNARVVFDWGLVPARLLADPVGQASTLLTSMFMHSPGTWWHLGGNMLFLWIFGDNVEDALGRGRFLAFYLASGLIAGLAQVAIEPASLVPMVGASGAIAGVLAAYGSLYARAPVLVLNPILPLWLLLGPLLRLPAWVLILEFVVLNLWQGASSLAMPAGHAAGIAFFAHLGGFVAGLVLLRLLLPSDWRAAREGGDWPGRWSPRPAEQLAARPGEWPWRGPHGEDRRGSSVRWRWGAPSPYDGRGDDNAWRWPASDPNAGQGRGWAWRDAGAEQARSRRRTASPSRTAQPYRPRPPDGSDPIDDPWLGWNPPPSRPRPSSSDPMRRS